MTVCIDDLVKSCFHTSQLLFSDKVSTCVKFQVAWAIGAIVFTGGAGEEFGRRHSLLRSTRRLKFHRRAENHLSNGFECFQEIELDARSNSATKQQVRLGVGE
jgi:hypothetical protein